MAGIKKFMFPAIPELNHRIMSMSIFFWLKKLSENPYPQEQ